MLTPGIPWDHEVMSRDVFQWIVVIELLVIIILLALPLRTRVR